MGRVSSLESNRRLALIRLSPPRRGVSLLNFLDEMPLIDRKNNSPLMMPISEKYSDMGTVIVGKVESGKLRKGQSLLLMPNKVCSPPCAPSLALINNLLPLSRADSRRRRGNSQRDGRRDPARALR
jgi:hypothetical protein